MKASLPLHSGGYQGDSVNLSSFKCVNLYPEKIIGDSSKVALIGTPGFSVITTIGTGPIRGAIEHLGDAYFVSGNEVIKYDTLGNKTTLSGTLNTASGIVSMSSNGVSGGQFTMTDGTSGYTCDGTTVSDIVDAQYLASPTKNCFIDGYTCTVFADTDYFMLSDAYDSTSYTTTFKARGERDPDKLKNCAANNRQLWLFGETTAEIWYNSGNTMPFDPLPNGFIETGIHAPNSLANIGSSGLIWMAQDKKGKGQIIHALGFQSRELTTPTILSEWRTYSRLDNAVAITYQEAGHIFYVLTFPTDDKTWAYDLTTELWHERQRGESGRIRADCYIYFNNMHIVGDFENSNIYELNLDTYTDNADYIHRYFTTAHVAENGETIRHNHFDLEAEVGVGLANGQGSDPQIWMDYSDDGGHLFNNKRYADLGIGGAFSQMVRWPFLGNSSNRVYRVGTSEPVKIRFNRALLDFNMRSDYDGKSSR